MIRFEMPEPGLSRAARWCLLLDGLLLACLMLWVSWNPDPYEQGPPVELPVARMPDFDTPYDIADDALFLCVTRDGRVWRGREPLDRLGESLDRAVLVYDGKMRAEGKNGFEDFPAGGSASGLRVFLRVDRAAPWGAVHRTLQRLGQSTVYRVYFVAVHGTRDRTRLQAFLPTADRDCSYVTARVGRDGGISLDGRDTPDLTGAIQAAYRPLKDGDKAVAGLIDADADTPFGDVFRALDAFACAGIVAVDLAAESVRAIVVPRPR